MASLRRYIGNVSRWSASILTCTAFSFVFITAVSLAVGYRQERQPRVGAQTVFVSCSVTRRPPNGCPRQRSTSCLMPGEPHPRPRIRNSEDKLYQSCLDACIEGIANITVNKRISGTCRLSHLLTRPAPLTFPQRHPLRTTQSTSKSLRTRAVIL